MSRILWRMTHNFIWQKGYLQHFYAFSILFFILGAITTILLLPQYQQLNQVNKQLAQIEKQIIDTMTQLNDPKYLSYPEKIQLSLQPTEFNALNEQLWMKLLNKLSPEEFTLLSLMTANKNSDVSQIELHLDYALLIEFFLSLYSAAPEIYFQTLKIHSLEHPRHVYLHATFSNIDIREE